jgi:hypothetical protein
MRVGGAQVANFQHSTSKLCEVHLFMHDDCHSSRVAYAIRPMRNLLALLAFAAVVVTLAVFAKRSSFQLPQPVREGKAPSTPRIVTKELANAFGIAKENRGEPEPAPAEVPLAPPLPLEQGTLHWEERIEGVLRDVTLNNTAKAQRLVAVFPELPAEGLATAAEECVARLPDADYDAVALPVIANPQIHGAVANVFFADLMERPDGITLPALLRIAQIPNHPYAKFSRENLRLLLDEDFGSDWQKWDAAVRTALIRKGE